MMHPEHRKINSEKDIYLKISDILYFYKINKADRVKTMRRLNFLKMIIKRLFNNEELLKVIDVAKDLIRKYDKYAYDEFIKAYKVEDKVKEGSILKWIK